MIDRIENWENVEANFGEAPKIKAGGYIIKILDARIEKSKSGQDMIVLRFDICEGEFADYYTKKWKRAKEQGKDYNWGGKFYIVIGIDGYDGRLKALTTSVEKSNAGYTWNWDEESLKGKIVGAIFRDEEFIMNDQIYTNAKIWQVRSVDTIRNGDFEIPKMKELTDDQKEKIEDRKESTSASAFGSTATDDDLPF